MFGIFGGGGSGPAPGDSQSPDVAGHYEKVLAEKDEEIEDLNAKVQALREALNQDESGMDDFEVAMSEKNKVLEESFGRIEELRRQNQALEARLQAMEASGNEGAVGSGGATQAPPPSAPSPEGGEQKAVGTPAETAGEAVDAKLAEEQRMRQLAEEAMRNAEQACAQLQQQLMELQQQMAHLAEEGEVARARAETGELAHRLAAAIAQTAESRREADSKSGTVAQAFALVHEGPEQLGAAFEQREKRDFGRGWPVVRVREGTWAHTAGVQAGDELHAVNGHLVEAVPEEQVMALLQQRPLHLHWVRNLPAPSPPSKEAPETAGPETVANAEAAEATPGAPQESAGAEAAGELQALHAELASLREASGTRVAEAEERARASEARAVALEDDLATLRLASKEDVAASTGEVSANESHEAARDSELEARLVEKERQLSQLKLQEGQAASRVVELEAELASVRQDQRNEQAGLEGPKVFAMDASDSPVAEAQSAEERQSKLEAALLQKDSEREEAVAGATTEAQQAAQAAEARALAAESWAEELERRLLQDADGPEAAPGPASHAVARVAELEAEVALLQERAAAHAAEEARLLQQSREQEALVSERAAKLAAEEARLLQQSRDQEAVIAERAAAHAAKEALLLQESRQKQAELAAAQSASVARVAELEAQVVSLSNLPTPSGAAEPSAADTAVGTAAESADDGWGDLNLEESSSGKAAKEVRVAELETRLEQLMVELQEAQQERQKATAQASEEEQQRARAEALAQQVASRIEELEAQLAKLGSPEGNSIFEEGGGAALAGELGADLQLRAELDRKTEKLAQAKQVAEAMHAELAVARGRLSHLEDTLQAEKSAHSSGVAGRLRAQVASLSQELLREREDRAKKEEELAQAVREARGDSDGAVALHQRNERLRAQRDQARSIAQCIAHQTAVLTGELERLRGAGAGAGSSGAEAGAELRSGTIVERSAGEAGVSREGMDPERTLLGGAPASPGEVEDRPEAAQVAPEAAAEPMAPAPGSAGSAGEGGPVAPRHQAGAATRREAEESNAPRPPDEVTSGWDVFDPDESAEQTIPLVSGDGVDRDGWGAGMDDLLEADLQVAGLEGPGGRDPELPDLP